jgi:hypothetical protein
LSTAPDRVQVWSAQLSANDFPPVCAMTGRPAQMWRKFKFSTPPTWSYALLILVCLGGMGIIAFAVVMALTAQRANGYLPLTKDSSRFVTLAFWVPIAVMGLAVVVWIAAFPVSSSSSIGDAAGWLFLTGLVLLLSGLAGRLIVTPLLCPRAKVMEVAPGQVDRIVELRNVHPAFVAAVIARQHERAARVAAPQPPPLPPPT